MEKLKVAVIGCGSFARNFVPLFQAHPYVQDVFVCDIVKDKAEEYKEKFNVEIIPTFEECIGRDDINCIAIFTERFSHASLAVAALNAGKHVYSAVPMAVTPEDCKAIIDAVVSTGKTYMMGETCIYYPCSMYCKKEYEKGTFGRFVYGEAQYFHDLSEFSEAYRNSDQRTLPPFYYPTHSTAMLLNATGSYVTRVTAMGYVDEDEGFRKDNNPWGNEFSDEFSLMQLANGGIARVSECRRIGYKAPSSYINGFYGTKSSYQFSNAQHILTTLNGHGVDLRDVSDEVNPYEMTENKGVDDYKLKVANHSWQWTQKSPVQDDEFARVPEEYKKIPHINGHMASHQLLIDDFCTAVYEGKRPTVDAWKAARYTIPGLIAHKSAQLGGAALDVPDYGEAPEDK